MPYASQAQQRFMHANHPTMARHWDNETKKAGGFQKLPTKIGNSDANQTRMNALERRVKRIQQPGPGKPQQSPVQTHHIKWRGNNESSRPLAGNIKNIVRNEQTRRQFDRAKAKEMTLRAYQRSEKKDRLKKAVMNRQMLKAYNRKGK